MIEKNIYLYMLEKYRDVSSWAIWADVGDKPKSNVGDMNVFRDVDLLKTLNTQYIFVGLNISRNLINSDWGNFHDCRSVAMDFKIRHALKNTPLWGSYMTDIFKDLKEKNSSKVPSYLNNHKEYESSNINSFREEIKSLGVEKPILIAFGKMVFKILEKNYSNEFDIKLVPHYASYMSKECYRDKVREVLNY